MRNFLTIRIFNIGFRIYMRRTKIKGFNFKFYSGYDNGFYDNPAIYARMLGIVIGITIYF